LYDEYDDSEGQVLRPFIIEAKLLEQFVKQAMVSQLLRKGSLVKTMFSLGINAKDGGNNTIGICGQLLQVMNLSME